MKSVQKILDMVSWCSSAFKSKNVWELKEVISNTYVVNYIFYTLYGEK